MKRIIFSVLVFVFTLQASRAQEVSAKWILSDSLRDCGELQYTCMQLIPLYYQEGIIDTANLLLQYWEKRCGEDETTYRTKVLWAIDQGIFSDSLVTNQTIGYLDHYLWLSDDTSGYAISLYNYYVDEPELIYWYKSFTDTIVSRAATYPDLSPAEHFFVQYYRVPSDSLLLLLETPELKDSKLARIYSQPIYGEWSATQFHCAFTGGAWIPYDKLTLLGTHPSLGGIAGVRHNKMVYNLGLSFRVGESANTYDVMYEDSMYESSTFTGIHIGLEAGRILLNSKRHEIDLLGGAALEMINTLSLENDPDTDEDDENHYIHSPSIHLGAAYKYYLKNDRYLGLCGRYHFLNFKNKQGSNLRGNALTLTLEYGLGSSSWLHKRNNYLNQRIQQYKK